MQQARKQREAVETIRRLGGRVEYDFEYDVNYRRIKGAKPPGPTWLQNLLGVDFFSDVYCVAWYAVDEEVVHLSALTDIRMLYLGEPYIIDDGEPRWQMKIEGEGEFTDAGLEHLKGLAKLELLDLSGTKVTDAGLERLKGFKDLKWLSLNSTQVSSAGLEHLKEMNWLEAISLNRTQVDDVGLEHLKGLTNLERLYVEATRVTGKGIKSLQQALRNCKIEH